MSKELKNYTPKELERILKITSNISKSLQDGHSQHPSSINANDLHKALNPSRLPSDTELMHIALNSTTWCSPNPPRVEERNRVYISALENAKAHPDCIDEMLKELKEKDNG